MPETGRAGPAEGPFSLGDTAAYGRWRADKLRAYPRDLEAQRVRVARLERPTGGERDALAAACRRANFAVYVSDPQAALGPETLTSFAACLGLTRPDRHLWAREDGIVALENRPGSRRAGYLPYTDRPMNWHTDGYYNAPDAAVRGVVMHCAVRAPVGGANWLLDPEMIYIALRDHDARLVEALMRPDAMTIPENTLETDRPRPAMSGPVFSVHAGDGALHMRYTARTRSISWKDDPLVREAAAFLRDYLTPPVEHAFRVSLEPGQGIVCNNVLHNREGFEDGTGEDQKRLLWRARFRERVAGTEPTCRSELARE